MSAKVLMAVAVTAELTGSEFSEPALRVMVDDLSAYPEPIVLRALDRCRKELRGRLTFGQILERIEEADGRPGADEAWAIAIAAQDEAETVVWTDEIAQAFGVAQPILDARDKVGARMAFRDAYERIIREGRAAGQQPRWTASLGHDPERRASALSAAIALRRIDSTAVQNLLPAPEQSPAMAGLLEGKPQALLESPDLDEEQRERARRGIEGIRAHLRELEIARRERDARHDEEAAVQEGRDARLKAKLGAQLEAYAAEHSIEIDKGEAA